MIKYGVHIPPPHVSLAALGAPERRAPARLCASDLDPQRAWSAIGFPENHSSPGPLALPRREGKNGPEGRLKSVGHLKPDLSNGVNPSSCQFEDKLNQDDEHEA